MYVPGSIDMALSGKEAQTTFNVTKYTAIALSSPKGIELKKAVLNDWPRWLGIVEDAGWLRNWQRSRFLRGAEGVVAGVAGAIFTSAVWGFGLEGWASSDGTLGVDGCATIPDGVWRGKNFSLKCICELQGIHSPNMARTWMWDDTIYRGCGLLVPVEYGYLDRWLEKLV